MKSICFALLLALVTAAGYDYDYQPKARSLANTVTFAYTSLGDLNGQCYISQYTYYTSFLCENGKCQ